MQQHNEYVVKQLLDSAKIHNRPIRFFKCESGRVWHTTDDVSVDVDVVVLMRALPAFTHTKLKLSLKDEDCPDENTIMCFSRRERNEQLTHLLSRLCFSRNTNLESPYNGETDAITIPGSEPYDIISRDDVNTRSRLLKCCYDQHNN